MEDRLRHRLPDTRNTRVVCRTGSPLDLTDLEMVNLNEARSIIVLAPEGATAEDADAYVLKMLLAINRGPAFRGQPHHVVAAVRDGRNRAVARLAGGDAVVIDGDDISARLRGADAPASPGSRSSTTTCSTSAATSSTSSPSRAWSAEPFGAGAARPTASAARSGCYHANGTTRLNPPMDTRDRGRTTSSSSWPRTTRAIKLADRGVPGRRRRRSCTRVRGPQAPERTLILGWNGRAVRIIEQLDIYVTAGLHGGHRDRPVRRRHGGGPARAARCTSSRSASRTATSATATCWSRWTCRATTT